MDTQVLLTSRNSWKNIFQQWFPRNKRTLLCLGFIPVLGISRDLSTVYFIMYPTFTYRTTWMNLYTNWIAEISQTLLKTSLLLEFKTFGGNYGGSLFLKCITNFYLKSTQWIISSFAWSTGIFLQNFQAFLSCIPLYILAQRYSKEMGFLNAQTII